MTLASKTARSRFLLFFSLSLPPPCYSSLTQVEPHWIPGHSFNTPSSPEYVYFLPRVLAPTSGYPNGFLPNITFSGMLALTTTSEIAFLNLFLPIILLYPPPTTESIFMWYSYLFVHTCFPFTRMYATIRAELLWYTTPGHIHLYLCKYAPENCAVHNLISCMQ